MQGGLHDCHIRVTQGPEEKEGAYRRKISTSVELPRVSWVPLRLIAVCPLHLETFVRLEVACMG